MNTPHWLPEDLTVARLHRWERQALRAIGYLALRQSTITEQEIWQRIRHRRPRGVDRGALLRVCIWAARAGILEAGQGGYQIPTGKHKGQQALIWKSCATLDGNIRYKNTKKN
jgi:hypothetical protein